MRFIFANFFDNYLSYEEHGTGLHQSLIVGGSTSAYRNVEKLGAKILGGVAELVEQ